MKIFLFYCYFFKICFQSTSALNVILTQNASMGIANVEMDGLAMVMSVLKVINLNHSR